MPSPGTQKAREAVKGKRNGCGLCGSGGWTILPDSGPFHNSAHIYIYTHTYMYMSDVCVYIHIRIYVYSYVDFRFMYARHSASRALLLPWPPRRVLEAREGGRASRPRMDFTLARSATSAIASAMTVSITITFNITTTITVTLKLF